jgi:hypothetical protein
MKRRTLGSMLGDVAIRATAPKVILRPALSRG